MSQALPLVTRQGDRIAIVSGLRTPFARQATAFHGVPAVDLGKLVVGEMLARSTIPADIIEQLVFGQVVQMPEAPNIAREIVPQQRLHRVVTHGANLLLIFVRYFRQ